MEEIIAGRVRNQLDEYIAQIRRKPEESVQVVQELEIMAKKYRNRPLVKSMVNELKEELKCWTKK